MLWLKLTHVNKIDPHPAGFGQIKVVIYMLNFIYSHQ